MKILIVSNSFLPQNSPRAFRTTELAKEFSNLGHHVTLYIPKYDYNYSMFLSQYKNIEIKESVNLNNKNIIIFGSKINNLLNKFLEVLFHYPYILLYFKLPQILKHEKNHDLVISIAFPHPIHWGTSRAFKQNPHLAKSWIADCGDPFMKNDGKGFRKKMFYFKYFEKDWCRKCAYITIPYEPQKNKYYPEFFDKIKIIPQGLNFKEVETTNKKVKNIVPTFIYGGTFYLYHRNPQLLLNFLSTLPTNFKFIIYTNRKDLVLPFKPKLGDKLEIREYIKRKELIYEMSKADFLVNIENGYVQNETDQNGSPSKLIDYSLAKRPVLAINTYQLDEENIKRFLSGDYSGQIKMPDIDQFNIKNVTAQFLGLCSQ